MTGRADLTSEIGQKIMAERLTEAVGREVIKFMTKEYFVKAIPDQFKTLQAVVKSVGTSKPVVIIAESIFFGSLPSMLGIGIRPTTHLPIGITPFFLLSIDTVLFGPGLLLNSTPEGRKKNIAMTKAEQAEFHETQATLNQVLGDLGALKQDLYFMDAAVLLPDR
jgi:hypothetical protein